MIVLDASVLIAHLDASDAHHDRATQLLIEAADEPLGVSPLTLAEVLVGPARAGKLPAAEAAVRDLQVNTIALTEDAPSRLAALRAATRLRLPDCCVLLAAQTAPAQTVPAQTGQARLATFDDRLAASAADLGLTVHT